MFWQFLLVPLTIVAFFPPDVPHPRLTFLSLAYDMPPPFPLFTLFIMTGSLQDADCGKIFVSPLQLVVPLIRSPTLLTNAPPPVRHFFFSAPLPFLAFFYLALACPQRVNDHPGVARRLLHTPPIVPVPPLF